MAEMIHSMRSMTLQLANPPPRRAPSSGDPPEISLMHAGDLSDCVSCIEKRPTPAARAEGLKALFKRIRFLAPVTTNDLGSQMLAFAGIHDRFNHPMRTKQFSGSSEHIDLSEMLLNTGIVDVMVTVLNYFPNADLQAGDPQWGAVKYHVLSIIGLMTGWGEVTESGPIKMPHESRWKKMASAFARQDLADAIMRVAGVGPMESLRAPYAMRHILQLQPSSSQLFLNNHAMAQLGKMSLPGYIENQLYACRELPQYVLSLCCLGQAGTFEPLQPLAITDKIARQRIMLRIPAMVESAGDILARIAAGSVSRASLVFSHPDVRRALMYWMTTPQLDADAENWMLVSYIELLNAICGYEALVPALLSECGIIDVFVRALYVPSAAVSKYLECLVAFMKSCNAAIDAVMGEPMLLDALMFCMLCDIEQVSTGAYECIKLCKSHDGWPAQADRLINEGAFTVALCCNISWHRDSSKAMGKALWRLFRLSRPDAIMPSQSQPSSAKTREIGNEIFKKGDHAAAIDAYTEAAALALYSCEMNEAVRIFGNRSVCHSALGNFWAAVQDASRALACGALDLDGADKVLTAKNLNRRATALCKLAGEGVAQGRNAVLLTIAVTDMSFCIQLRQASSDMSAERVRAISAMWAVLPGPLHCTSCNAVQRAFQLVCHECKCVAFCGRKECRTALIAHKESHTDEVQ